jgi:elongation factor G
MAFQIAGSLAIKEALQEAAPVLLEPIMNVEVAVPDKYLGNVTGDLNGRRGRVIGTEPRGSIKLINALVPLADMDHYSTDLRSMTKGTGSYHMKLSHYEKVPSHISEKIIAEEKENKEVK